MGSKRRPRSLLILRCHRRQKIHQTITIATRVHHQQAHPHLRITGKTRNPTPTTKGCHRRLAVLDVAGTEVGVAKSPVPVRIPCSTEFLILPLSLILRRTCRLYRYRGGQVVNRHRRCRFRLLLPPWQQRRRHHNQCSKHRDRGYRGCRLNRPMMATAAASVALVATTTGLRRETSSLSPPTAWGCARDGGGDSNDVEGTINKCF